MSIATLRTLARELGISPATVSEALRGTSRVNVSTAERVRRAAAQAGYRRNPLTGSVMSELRRSNGQIVRGVLAVLEWVPKERPSYAVRYNAGLMQGISERSAELGFTVERFEFGAEGQTPERVDSVLQSRAIRGVLVLPAPGLPDLSPFSWKNYVAIYLDYLIESPPLHCVCSDHYRSMLALASTLRDRGYRRPGLVIDKPTDARIHFRWAGAFRAFQQSLPDSEVLPILLLDTPSRGQFEPWFKRHKPDVVLTHLPQAIAWMKSCGAQLGETHGYVCLNATRTDSDCAALDLQPRLLGARGTELAMGQLLNNEYGVPACASLTTIPARLIEGPTLRAVPPPSF